jgi:hypothetical protein
LYHFRDKLEALRRGENKTHRQHVKWTRTLSYPADQVGQSTAAAYGMPGASVSRVFDRRPYVVTGTFVYSYAMPDAGGLRSKIGGFLDALGLNVDPSIVWNAIPFTFVVDWFFDVSRWLQSLRMESLGIAVRLESCSVSCKTEASCAYTLTWPQAGWSHTGAIVKRFGYERVVLDPASVMGAVSPDWKTPSGSAFISATALSHQLSGQGRKLERRRRQVGRVPLLSLR